jgi:hypothetical protein
MIECCIIAPYKESASKLASKMFNREQIRVQINENLPDRIGEERSRIDLNFLRFISVMTSSGVKMFST